MWKCVLNVESKLVTNLTFAMKWGVIYWVGIITYVSCCVLGIVASSVRGASEACVCCHCSRMGLFN